MKVAVYGRAFDKSFLGYIQTFFDYLSHYRITVDIYKEFYSFMKEQFGIQPSVNNTFTGYKDIAGDIDFVISIGGDGTFLDTTSLVRDTNIPVIGINSGKLGFLANIAREDIAEAIKSLYYGKYVVEERSMLYLNTDEMIFPDFNYALNDMTIQKKDSQMIAVQVYLDGSYLNTYWADGLIIATPTGSTAYSLSVGGPVVLPDTNNFIISPISPHNLTVRPIVVPDHSEILLRTQGRCSKYLVSMDHRSKVIENKKDIKVQKADFTIKVLRLESTNFYTTLRNKLMWGVDKRN